MLRGLAWIGKTIAAALIISFLSIWTTGFIVTSYVEAIMRQFELPIEVPPIAMSGVWGKLWGSDPLLVSDLEKEQGTADTGEAAEPEAEAVFGGIRQGDEIGESDGMGDDNKGNGEAVSGETHGMGDDSLVTDETGSIGEKDLGDGDTGSAGSTGEGAYGNSGAAGENGGADGTETAVTSGEIEAAKDGMSEEDKSELFELLMSKVPPESWLQISEYMEEGLTEQELIEVQQIMAQHLDREEYEQMMEILKKY